MSVYIKRMIVISLSNRDPLKFLQSYKMYLIHHSLLSQTQLFLFVFRTLLDIRAIFIFALYYILIKTDYFKKLSFIKIKL